MNNLEELIPNFRVFPENVRTGLTLTESDGRNSQSSFDAAPAIMSYCTALEINFKEVVFRKFVGSMKSADELNKLAGEANKDRTVNQFRSLIAFIKTGYLELGIAAQFIKLSRGEAGEKVSLRNKLNRFLLARFKKLTDGATIKLIEGLAINARNPSVHEKFSHLMLSAT